MVIVFCFCSQNLVFVLFSNFGFKMWFSTVFNPFFLFGDCFQWRVFIYNCHKFHSLHMTFTPLNPWAQPKTHHHQIFHWPPQTHQDHYIKLITTGIKSNKFKKNQTPSNIATANRQNKPIKPPQTHTASVIEEVANSQPKCDHRCLNQTSSSRHRSPPRPTAKNL